MTAKTLETKMLERAQANFEQANETINTFKTNLDNDAFNAMEWSDKVFVAAAKKRVATTISHYLEDGKTILELKALITDIVLRSAQFPGHSTSQASNMCEQELLAQYAEVLQTINYWTED